MTAVLQGPHGPFFDRLGRLLRAAGAAVWRCGFNAGDEFFWSDAKSFIRHQGSADDWPDHLATILDDKGVTDIVLYGDVRPIHATARRLAAARGLRQVDLRHTLPNLHGLLLLLSGGAAVPERKRGARIRGLVGVGARGEAQADGDNVSLASTATVGEEQAAGAVSELKSGGDGPPVMTLRTRGLREHVP